jgi:hypothetical protein
MLACFAFLINLGLLLCWHVTSALHIGAGYENGAQQLQNTQLESNGVTDYGNWYVISPRFHSLFKCSSSFHPFPLSCPACSGLNFATRACIICAQVRREPRRISKLLRQLDSMPQLQGAGRENAR